MDFIILAIQRGGPLMWPVILLGVASLPYALMLGVLTGMGKRVPLLLWMLPVGALTALGLLGTANGMAATTGAVAVASPDTKAVLATVGVSLSLYTYTCGLFLSYTYLALATFAASIGSWLGTRGPSVPNRLVAAGVALFGIVGGLGIVGWAITSVFGAHGLYSGLALLLGAPCLAFAVCRRSDGDPAAGAEARLAAALCLWLWPISAMLGGHIAGHIRRWDAIGREGIGAALSFEGLQAASGAVSMGAAATLVGLILVGASVIDQLRAALAPRISLSVGAALASGVAMSVVHIGVYRWVDGVLQTYAMAVPE